MNYNEALIKLNGRQSKKLANNTYLEKHANEDIAVRLHATDVLTFHVNGTTTATSGGWKTSTTKDRLNSFMPAGYGIYQKRGVWYWVKRGEETLLPVFTDGDKIGARGSLQAQAKPGADKKQLKERARVSNYAKLFGCNGPLELPGAGDCFFCQMVVSGGPDNGKPLGDVTNHEHIRSHMDEKYVVPSLAMNALREANVGPLVIQACFKIPGDELSAKDWGKSLRKTYLPRAVRKYVLKRLNMAA